MKLAIMQPYFLPYIGYFQLINAVDKFVLLDDVAFINRGWINRNRILINGQPGYITIPLKKSSQNKLINEIEIYEDNKWRKKMLKTIEINYKKAPYFPGFFPVLTEIINFEPLNISVFNYNSIKLISNYIGIKTKFVKTSTLYNNHNLKGKNKIIDICIKEKADHYINLSGGKNLYNKQEFAAQNIKLSFLESLKIQYQQFKNQFIPCLSILDILMFNSKEYTRNLLNKYKLS